MKNNKKLEATLTEWVPSTEKEIGCGYCKYELTCDFYKARKAAGIRKNWARAGCPAYKQYSK